MWVSLGKLIQAPRLLGHRGTPTVRGGHLVQGMEGHVKRMIKGEMRSFLMVQI